MIGIGLLCVEYDGDQYKKHTLNSIRYWSKNYQVVVLTNTPDFFVSENCTTLQYQKDKFNYHDKMVFLGMLTKFYELAVLVDVNKLPATDILFNEEDFEPGLHSADRWLVGWKELNELPLVNGFSYWKYWDDNLHISDMSDIPVPICERILAVKRHKNFTKYVKLIEKKYRKISVENDKMMAVIDSNRKDWVEGRAEGFSFALAAEEMKFPLFCPSFPLYRIKDDLKRQYL